MEFFRLGWINWNPISIPTEPDQIVPRDRCLSQMSMLLLFFTLIISLHCLRQWAIPSFMRRESIFFHVHFGIQEAGGDTLGL